MPGPELNEQQPDRYVRAARFPSERSARRAYFRAQETIFEADCDLLALRLSLDRAWHVGLIGHTPPERIDQQVRRILVDDEAAILPEDVLRLLEGRRARASAVGSWVEGYYRPGRCL